MHFDAIVEKYGNILHFGKTMHVKLQLAANLRPQAAGWQAQAAGRPAQAAGRLAQATGRLAQAAGRRAAGSGRRPHASSCCYLPLLLPCGQLQPDMHGFAKMCQNAWVPKHSFHTFERMHFDASAEKSGNTVHFVKNMHFKMQLAADLRPQTAGRRS